MTDAQNSYRKIVKNTSIFGGVQFFNVIISIVRSKAIALILGPEGIGITGLFNSTTGLISSITTFGITTSAVKDIAEAQGTNNQSKIVLIVSVFRKLVLFTGMLGLVTTAILSPLLSKLTFGSYDYTLAFLLLSITLLIGQLSSGQLVILRGLQKVQVLAKVEIFNSILGLLIAISLYYLFKTNGIVPAIIVTATSSLLISTYYSKKVNNIETEKITLTKFISVSKRIVKMGLLINLGGLLSILTAYILRVYIGNKGGLDDVGFYNAGFAILNTYVGMIFAAMATDYLPRLAAVSNDNAKCKQTINHQSEIALLILAPILILFLVYIKWAIILLYSNQFTCITEMLYWSLIGMYFKTMSWAIGYVFLAKGTSRLFFWSELIANVYVLIINIVFYYFWGLTGLGFAFLASYCLYLLQVFIISKVKYGFSFENELLKILSLQLVLTIACYINIKLSSGFLQYLIGSFIFLISLAHSLFELNRRIALKEVMVKYRQKLFKK